MSNHAHDKDVDQRQLAAQAASDDSDMEGTVRMPSSGSLSIIGPGLEFRGDLLAEEDLLIQGRVEGSIKHTGANLTIGAHGKIKADVVGRKIIVQGEVRGDIRASESVLVEMAANVHGNVFAPRVGIKDGARFRGSIDMDAAPTQATKQSSDQVASPKTKGNNKPKRRPESHELGEPSVDVLLE